MGLFLALGTLALLLAYGSFRQRYVGACDWYGYYSEAELFLQGRLVMPIGADVATHPAATPLGFEALDGRVVPRYPPGYPLLLAAGALLGAEFLVSPLCAALTVLVIYLILVRRVSRVVAFCIAAAWAACPMVIWGAGNIMSDLPAALALMTCYCLLDRDWPYWAGLVFSLAVAIRPSNIVFGLLLLPLFGSWRRLGRFAVTAAAGGALYGLYNWEVFGAPWRLGYRGSLAGFGIVNFPRHFGSYGWLMLTVLTPLPILLASGAAVRRWQRSLFFLAWLAAFWVLYSFWWVDPSPWWYLRFLLPGLPGLFVLAADGLEGVRRWGEPRGPRYRRIVQGGIVVATAGMVVYSLVFCYRNNCFKTDTAKVFHDVAMSAKEHLPRNALIGAFDHTGSLRHYGGFDTFQIPHPGSPRLVEDTVKTGRPVYLLLESGLRKNAMMRRLLAEYEVDAGAPLEGWPNARVVRIIARKPKPPHQG